MRPDDPSLLRDTEARVLAWCEQAGLVAHGQRVAAAVSGGADSMALLRILLALAGRLEVEVSACHVNHKLRGAAADADEAFVREECARLGVPLQVCRAGEDGLPLAGGGEAGARALRYACFERVHAGGIDRIATAHTVTDQAETLLFRLARGAGLHGAGGIRPARDFYVRPLLCLTRAEVEAYCRAAGQGWLASLLAAGACAVGIFFLQAAVRRKKKYRLLGDRDRAEAVKAVYDFIYDRSLRKGMKEYRPLEEETCRHMAGLWESVREEEMMWLYQLVLESMFFHKCPSREEYSRAMDICRRTEAEMYRELKGWQKWKYKYIWCL